MTRKQRSLTEAELHVLAGLRPSLLFPRRRRKIQAELTSGLGEEVKLEALRVWDLTECSPGCCPNSYLIDGGGGQFLFVESWQHLERIGTAFPGTEIQITRSPISRHILSVVVGGPPLALQPESVRELAFDLGGVECEILTAEQLPSTLREKIQAA